MYYLQSRYYDPEIGRFVNADVPDYVEITGENLFTYCTNRPTKHVDYSGFCYDQAYWSDINFSVDYGALTGVEVAEDIKNSLFAFGRWFLELLRDVVKWFYPRGRKASALSRSLHSSYRLKTFTKQWVRVVFVINTTKIWNWYSKNWTLTTDAIGSLSRGVSLTRTLLNLRKSAIKTAPISVNILIFAAVCMIYDARCCSII